ncbi:hypothetical protein FACS1894167_14600 [Synergistales bacterium]|nr:hypothetical protein FACS1894167_14600 [Synergistales bacterium]
MENMLAHPNISLETGVDADARLSVEGGVLSFDGERFEDAVIYTGSLDKLMRYKYGALPYRTLDFVTKKTAWPFQPVAVVNYPDSRPYTRTMESGHFYPGNDYNFSRVTYEYPLAYEPDSDREPYYPIPSERGAEIYKLYMNDASAARNFYPAGRLGGYRYINMDAAVLDGLAAAEKVICKN